MALLGMGDARPLALDMQVAGTSGKVQQGMDEDTEGISSETHAQAITEVLGEKRRNEVSNQAFA